jgi:hypothetical protein
MTIRNSEAAFAPDCVLVTTRTRLERALHRTLLDRYGSTLTLRGAVAASARELRAQGLNDGATLDVLGALVEDAGRASRADRLDLLSGKPRWIPIRLRVLDWAQRELSRPIAAN